MTVTELRHEGIRIAKGDGWIFFALIVFVVAIGESLKVFRTPALLLMVGLAVVYARETMLRKQNLPLLLFSVVGFLYVVLSYLQAFPPAWTRYYDTGAILQQASFIGILLPFVAASQKWWEDSRFESNREVLLIFVVLAAFVLGIVVDYLLGSKGVRPFMTLRNYVFIGLLSLSYLAFRSDKWRSFATLALLLLAGWSIWRVHFLQNTIVYLILLGFLATTVLRVPADRMMLALILVAIAAATLVGLQDPLWIFQIDPNTGWRLAWWNDVLAATVQTNGIGVGFGTESLRNEYSSVLLRDTYREEAADFLFVGTHSAFFDTMFRMGIPGFLLLCFVIVRCFPPSYMSLSVRAHCGAMFAILILCLHSNLGLQSPMYSLGVAMCIGYLQAERHKARLQLAMVSNEQIPRASSIGSLAR
jgi:O-antigen ligase